VRENYHRTTLQRDLLGIPFFAGSADSPSLLTSNAVSDFWANGLLLRDGSHVGCFEV